MGLEDLWPGYTGPKNEGNSAAEIYLLYNCYQTVSTAQSKPEPETPKVNEEVSKYDTSLSKVIKNLENHVIEVVSEEDKELLNTLKNMLRIKAKPVKEGCRDIPMEEMEKRDANSWEGMYENMGVDNVVYKIEYSDKLTEIDRGDD